MRVTNADVDRILDEMVDFNRLAPGAGFGADYAEWAMTVAGAESFECMVASCFHSHVAQMEMFRPQIESYQRAPAEAKRALLDSMIRNCIQRDELMRAIYLGMRLGRLSMEDRG